MDPIPARYSRQTLFEGIGPEGQLALMRSRAAVVGCGALGSMQASLLVRAGVGTVRIIDRDFVEESNLQRQVLFDDQDARDMLPKAVAAEQKLRAANSLVAVEGVVEDLNADTAERLLSGFDVILDGTDNFDARFLLNDFAVKTGTPWVYGACVGSYGLTFPILPGETACLRCVFEHAPPPGLSPSCDTAGVLGSIAGVIASLQASTALQILVGQSDHVGRKIALFDLWESVQELVDLPPRDENCPCCGRRQFEYLDGGQGSETTTLCGRDSVQVGRRGGSTLDLDELARRLAPLGTVERTRFLLRADIEAYRLTVFADGRAIIGGTSDPAVAKSVYARYVGS
jgi:molybdopterin-synthase adenylyltransferase